MASAAATAALALLLAVLGGCGGGSTEPEPPPGPPFQLSDFSSPTTCRDCHPNHYAEWQASMHAYAFKDPLFFSGNFAEVDRSGGTLKQFCVGCHSPIGTLTGTTPDGHFDPQTLPEIVRDGISCDVCHLLSESPPAGATEAGVPLPLSPGDVKYGPLPARDNGAGVHKTEQRTFFASSNHCRSCHNLTVNGVELERTFKEWEESIYASRGDGHCQNCHMPTYSGQAAVGGPIRAELHRHWFAGVDLAFTDFPDTAASRQRAADLLRGAATLDVIAPTSAAPGETLSVTVGVFNGATGHSLPSGTSFSRQMWIEITAANGGNTLYRSGQLDPNQDLLDRHSAVDPNGDPDLFLFTSELQGGDDVSVFSATGITEHLLGVNVREARTYRVPIPAGAAGAIDVAVRLRFRPFPPYKARAQGETDVSTRIPIFDMAEANRTVMLR
jgi:hypothetical protein